MLDNENDNADANSNNIIFTIKDTKLSVPVVTLSEKENQKLSKFHSTWFKRIMYWNNINQKMRIKIQQMNIGIFSNQTLLELTDWLF